MPLKTKYITNQLYVKSQLETTAWSGVQLTSIFGGTTKEIIYAYDQNIR